MATRPATPWDSIGALRFMQDVIREAEGATAEATLTVRRRDDVATRRWYALSWTSGDGSPRAVEASDLTLLLLRAAAAELEARARVEAAWGED